MDRDRLIDELEDLYRRSYRRFLRVAIAVVGDESVGHDVVQEAFARAIRLGASYRGDGPREARCDNVDGWFVVRLPSA